MSSAIAISLYISYGSRVGVDSLAHILTTIGICSGLVATTLVCNQLLLAARVPLIDNAIGHDRALEIHKKMGKWAFLALAFHMVCLLFGYAASDGVGLFTEFGQLWAFADFMLAVAGFVLMFAIGFTCFAFIREVMDHDLWWLIHTFTYAATLISIPHMWSMSGVIGGGGWQGWYWKILLAATFFVVLMWRVFLPLFDSLQHRLFVESVVPESDDVVSITMRGKGLAGLETEAGQFFHWRFLARGLWWHQHPFSVSARPTDDRLRITARRLGRGTARLMHVKPGTRVLVEGPYGIFSDQVRTQPGLVLIGFGIGIAPIRAILEETPITPEKTVVILRASTDGDLFLRHEVERLCRERGAELIELVGHRAVDPGGAPQWVPASAAGKTLVDFAPFVAHADVYVCGPQAAADLVMDDARRAGTPETALHNERFAW